VTKSVILDPVQRYVLGGHPGVTSKMLCNLVKLGLTFANVIFVLGRPLHTNPPPLRPGPEPSSAILTLLGVDIPRDLPSHSNPRAVRLIANHDSVDWEQLFDAPVVSALM
jgi:hypothetical protein